MPRASTGDTLAVLADVVLPLLARGLVARRPRLVGLAARLDADKRAIRRLVRLRDRYGPEPLLLRVPGRDVALLLSPGDVHRVLVEEAEAFAPANREKRAALSHFQPRGVLVSEGPERLLRRRFNEAVLEADRPVHRLAGDLVVRAREEAHDILEDARRAGSLTWDEFAAGWWRMARRVVLGDSARHDHRVTDTLTRLRRDANWAYLKPKRTKLRKSLYGRLAEYLARAEPGSLASLIGPAPKAPETAPADQVAHWLFAFDAGGMASFTALALLDAHPNYAGRVRHDLRDRDLSRPQDLPLLRAALLESVRLWPTTPAVLRDTKAPTAWGSSTLPSGTALVIFAPFFHRDSRRLSSADSFSPEIWRDADGGEGGDLIPFSEGPAACPGRNLVLLLGSSLLAALMDRHHFRQAAPRTLDAARPLPATLSPFGLRFEVVITRGPPPVPQQPQRPRSRPSGPEAPGAAP